MRKLVLIGAVILIIVGLFVWGNVLLNSFKPIDRLCETHADCTMRKTDCSNCAYGSRGGAVNVAYEPFCPLPTLGGLCPQALPEWAGKDAVCIEGRCEARDLPEFTAESCPTIASQIFRDVCYRSVAYQTKDATLCAQISNAEWREQCIRSTNK